MQIMLLPVMAYWFCEISVYGLLLNLVVVPLMPIVLLSGGTGAVLGIVSTALGSLTFAPCHYGLLIFEKLCGLTGRLPAAVIVTGRPELICIILYYVILILWLVSEKRIKVLWKKRFMGILTMVIMLPFLFLHRTERLEITYLDVGQGDAAFWKTSGGLTFFCDGGSSDVSKVGTYRIVPFLKQKGVDTVDYWILTHMDADHINGMEEIMEMMETGMDDISIGHLILPELRERDETYLEIAKRAEKCGIPVIYAKRGDVWTGEDVTFRVLHPGEEQTGLQQNETSLVFSLECGEFTALFTGDVEGEGESQLVESGALAKADVLKVAHHGSGGSTGEIFLNKVQPQVAILSYGEGNSYGHPDIACLTRLKDRETVIFKTAEHGAVEVHTNGNGYRIKTVCTRSKPVLK